jgi:hypothetical protein
LLGNINGGRDLFDLIERAKDLPQLDYSFLNPFESILSLESTRRRRDHETGIDPMNNPYLPSLGEVGV